MNLPDFANLSLSQIAGILLSLAALVFITGLGKAITTATVLWTYCAAWLTDWAGKALVLLAVAAVGKGIPPLLEPNQWVQILFIPAAIAYTAAALASLAKNLGVDLSNLPFARNAAAVFGTKAVRSDVTPAATSGNPPT